MLRGLDGKAALATGGSRGIGKLHRKLMAVGIDDRVVPVWVEKSEYADIERRWRRKHSEAGLATA